MKYDPCVFVLEDTYELFVITNEPCMLRVEVGNEIFSDSFCGILCSEGCVRHTVIPRAALDAARSYTVCLTQMLERSAYNPKTGVIQRKRYSFSPVPQADNIIAYWISDTHGMVDEPVLAFEQERSLPDFLMMGGDIADNCDDPLCFYSLHDIAGRLVHGTRPVVFIRGNHDTRGLSAELLPRYVGLFHGKTYGTVRIGKIAMVVLDAGEDKDEQNPAYGGTAIFHSYRCEQTQFLQALLERRSFEERDLSYRIAACHIPFTTPLERDGEAFGIEGALYAEWTALVNRLRPNLMICGHTHAIETSLPGDDFDLYHQNFPVVMGAQVTLKDQGTPSFQGTILHFSGGSVETRFVP